MTISRPALPARVMAWPLAPWVKVALFCVVTSTLVGAPFWNSIVMRSYPVWVPVRIPSMNATGGCGGDVVFVTKPVYELQEKGGKFESGGVWIGVAETLGLGLGTLPGTTL